MKFNEIQKNYWKSECGRFSIQRFRFKVTPHGTKECAPYFNSYRHYDGKKIYDDAPTIGRAIRACDDADSTISR